MTFPTESPIVQLPPPIRPRAVQVDKLLNVSPALIQQADKVRTILFGVDKQYVGIPEKVELFKGIARTDVNRGYLVTEDVLGDYMGPIMTREPDVAPGEVVMQVGTQTYNLSASKPVRIGSIAGGVNIQSVNGKSIQISVKDEFGGQGVKLEVVGADDVIKHLLLTKGFNDALKGDDQDPTHAIQAADVLENLGMYIMDGLVAEHATTSDQRKKSNIEKTFSLISEQLEEAVKRNKVTIPVK